MEKHFDIHILAFLSWQSNSIRRRDARLAILALSARILHKKIANFGLQYHRAHAVDGNSCLPAPCALACACAGISVSESNQKKRGPARAPF